MLMTISHVLTWPLAMHGVLVDFEMTLLAHMLDIVVYSYKAGQYWIACSPHGIDHSVPEDVNRKSMYIYYTGNHYEVVTSVAK